MYSRVVLQGCTPGWPIFNVRYWYNIVVRLHLDSFEDICVSSHNGLDILINNKDNTYNHSWQEKISNVEDIDVFDSNGNSIPDITIAYSQGQRLYLNTLDNEFIDSGQVFKSSNTQTIYGADFDNDGLSDIALGLSNCVTIFQNQEFGKMVDRGISFPELHNVKIIKGADFDNDGDVDLILGLCGKPSKILINNCQTQNRFPDPPTNLNWESSLEVIKLSWSQGYDTVQNRLSYNVRVGSASNQNDILACECEESRQTISRGNVGYSNSIIIPKPPAGTYYFSVQSIDAAFKRSVWSEEKIFIVY